MSITTESIPFYEIGDISGLQAALDAKVSTEDFNIALGNKLDSSILPSLAQLGVSNTFTANQTINANLAVGGTFAATERLKVKGNGTNSIARFENFVGNYHVTISEYLFGTILSMNGFSIRENTSSILFSSNNNGTSAIGELPVYDFTSGTDNSTSLNSNFVRISRTFAAGAGSANFRPFTVSYTINNSGAQTGNATGIFLNATETALNGMAHNLIDLQVGGSSRFSVTRLGQITTSGAIIASAAIYGSDFGLGGGTSFIKSNTSGIISLYNNNSTSFNRLQFGGTTNLFTSIKVNGTELQSRLADDSGYANFAANIYTAYGKTNLAPSTASYASLNIKSGTTPTSPIDGDIWNDGIDLYMRINGTTKRFSFAA